MTGEEKVKSFKVVRHMTIAFEDYLRKSNIFVMSKKRQLHLMLSLSSVFSSNQELLSSANILHTFNFTKNNDLL